MDYYAFCLVVNSSLCDDVQLDLLIKTLTEQNYLNEIDYNNIYKSANKNVCLLDTIHLKPIICFELLKILCKTKLLKSLQEEVYIKIAEITVDICIEGKETSYGKFSNISPIATDMNTATFSDDIVNATGTAIASTATSITIVTSTTTSTTPTTTNTTTITTTATTTATTIVHTFTSDDTNLVVASPTTSNSTRPQSKYHTDTLPFNIECCINGSHNPKVCQNYTQDSTLPSNDVMAITDVVHDYQTRLKYIYDNLPEVSTQGWFDNSVQKRSINVTLVKSQEKDTNYVEEYYCSTQQMIIKGDVAYGTQEYVHYNEIFQLDCSIFQLLLIEGNAGTGKTTLAYRVCKKWAKGEVLQQYSCILLLQLRDIKPGDVISLKSLLGAVSHQFSNDLYTELFNMHGSGILIWLEGWDELDDNIVRSSAFDTLLHGIMLPKANVVITTRPSATRSLKKFTFTHKFKIIGFVQEQIEKYVSHYCANNSKLAEEFMVHLNSVPGLVYLSTVPMYLAILVRLFKANRQLSQKLTDLCNDFVTVYLQHHKEKVYGNNVPITSFDKLPTEMQSTFYCLQKCAYEQLICHSQRSLTEEQVSEVFFNCSSVPDNFDGFGLLNINNIKDARGISKTYEFQCKPIQEFLSGLFLTRLEKTDVIKEMLETFKKQRM